MTFIARNPEKAILVYSSFILALLLMQYFVIFEFYIPSILTPFQSNKEIYNDLHSGFGKIILWMSFWPASFFAYLSGHYYVLKKR